MSNKNVFFKFKSTSEEYLKVSKNFTRFLAGLRALFQLVITKLNPTA